MLRSERITLREWRETDLEALARLRNDIELQTLLMACARPSSIDRVRSWLVNRAAQDDTVFFVVADNDDHALGYLQVVNIDLFHGHGKFGICLVSDVHGSGVAAGACAILEGYLAKTLGIQKLVLEVMVENSRAIAFYRKIGYREVGVLKRHFRSGGAFHDVLVMERALCT